MTKSDDGARTFGENLRAERIRSGLTQDQLATRLGFACPSQVSLWERPTAPLPAPKTMVKLARALGCATAALLRDVVTPYDTLRGSVSVVTHAETISADERIVLQHLRALPVALARSHARLIAAQARSLRGRGRDASRSASRGLSSAPPMTPSSSEQRTHGRF